MNINPLWFVCIFIRMTIALLVWNLKEEPSKNRKVLIAVVSIILLIMGSGFIYYGITGSDNETQVARVFWHNTRLIHGAFYIISSISLFVGYPKIASLLIMSDILFSIIYRIVTDQ